LAQAAQGTPGLPTAKSVAPAGATPLIGAMSDLGTQLFSALQHNKDAAEIKKLVNRDTASTPDSFYGMKPLFWALSHGASTEVIQMLMDNCPSAATEVYEPMGWTPLHFVEHLDAASFKVLLKAFPEAAKMKDKDGNLPLHWAAEHNAPVEIVESLLDVYKDAAKTEDKLGRIPYKLARDNYVHEAVLDALMAANKKGALALPPADDKLPVGLIFPGEGSQYVGMLKTVKDLPKVARMLDEAKEILGYDLLDICMNGPDSRLQEPEVLQPAMYVAGLAAFEKLKAENVEPAVRACCVAGLGVGEYAALCAAGVFSFGAGLRLVRARVEAMQEAANLCPQVTLSVAGIEHTKLEELCTQAMSDLNAKEGGGQEICQIANVLFKKGYTVGGTQAAVEECQRLVKNAKAMQSRLIKGSGGFHTALMRSARRKFENILMDSALEMSPPHKYKVYTCLEGQSFERGTLAKAIAGVLAIQITTTVNWKAAVEHMVVDGVNKFYELGPMKQLKAMMKRIDNAAFNGTQNVEV